MNNWYIETYLCCHHAIVAHAGDDGILSVAADLGVPLGGVGAKPAVGSVEVEGVRRGGGDCCGSKRCAEEGTTPEAIVGRHDWGCFADFTSLGQLPASGRNPAPIRPVLALRILPILRR